MLKFLPKQFFSPLPLKKKSSASYPLSLSLSLMFGLVDKKNWGRKKLPNIPLWIAWTYASFNLPIGKHLKLTREPKILGLEMVQASNYRPVVVD